MQLDEFMSGLLLHNFSKSDWNIQIIWQGSQDLKILKVLQYVHNSTITKNTSMRGAIELNIVTPYMHYLVCPRCKMENSTLARVLHHVI
jgi:hypothetical protein